jgi:hypothetical protein
MVVRGPFRKEQLLLFSWQRFMLISLKTQGVMKFALVLLRAI